MGDLQIDYVPRKHWLLATGERTACIDPGSGRLIASAVELPRRAPHLVLSPDWLLLADGDGLQLHRLPTLAVGPRLATITGIDKLVGSRDRTRFAAVTTTAVRVFSVREPR